MKKKVLYDPRYTGALAMLLLLVGFIDVLFVSDARSLGEMTVWGKIFIIGFFLDFAWMAIFMVIIPTFKNIFK